MRTSSSGVCNAVASGTSMSTPWGQVRGHVHGVDGAHDGCFHPRTANYHSACEFKLSDGESRRSQGYLCGLSTRERDAWLPILEWNRDALGKSEHKTSDSPPIAATNIRSTGARTFEARCQCTLRWLKLPECLREMALQKARKERPPSD